LVRVPEEKLFRALDDAEDVLLFMGLGLGLGFGFGVRVVILSCSSLWSTELVPPLENHMTTILKPAFISLHSSCFGIATSASMCG